MRRIEISILGAIIFSVVLSMCTVGTECASIRDSVLRLHVLANSDSNDDQALKLKVRDRLLDVSGELYAECDTKEEAVSATRKSLDALTSEAESVVRECGFDYPVRISLEESYFNTRTYGNVTLPAGNYQAVRVIIGEGKGHNWWCVMFPPLCVSPASEDSVGLDDVLTPEQMELVECDGYEIKFKCVELYEELRKYLVKRS